MLEEIWELLIAFCFLQYTFWHICVCIYIYTYLTRQLHTQEHPSQSSSHPPTSIPYSRATPPVSDSGRHYVSLHVREANYTAVPEAWHERFPTWQRWGIHTLLHLCMTAGSSKTPGWTSTTKRLPLSLQLWHKQRSFSPVLQPKAPALILQKKCQTRVRQPSKPNSPAPMKLR